MNVFTLTDLNVILNQWSLTIQMSILGVFVIIFFALKLNSPRRVINSWFKAWLLNATALIMVIFVLKGGDYFSLNSLRIFYTMYAIAKIGFAILLFVGLYQILNERNLISSNGFKLLLTLSVFLFLILILFSIDLLHIQIIVYCLVGSIFFIGSILQIKLFWFKNSKIILLLFLIEGLVFLHHGFILIPVALGQPLPDYMTHISFFDAIIEMIVGISCLFVIANKVIEEISSRNIILAKSQSTLRQLVNVDPLTGLWHRRYFDAFLKQYDTGACIVYFKIDHLTAINDEWGYSVGDLCIKEMCKIMKEFFQKEDGLFRIKGNSFLIISPGNNEKAMNTKMQHFKNKVAANPMCAPIISISSRISSYQKRADLESELLKKD